MQAHRRQSSGEACDQAAGEACDQAAGEACDQAAGEACDGAAGEACDGAAGEACDGACSPSARQLTGGLEALEPVLQIRVATAAVCHGHAEERTGRPRA